MQGKLSLKMQHFKANTLADEQHATRTIPKSRLPESESAPTLARPSRCSTPGGAEHHLAPTESQLVAALEVAEHGVEPRGQIEPHQQQILQTNSHSPVSQLASVSMNQLSRLVRQVSHDSTWSSGGGSSILDANTADIQCTGPGTEGSRSAADSSPLASSSHLSSYKPASKPARTRARIKSAARAIFFFKRAANNNSNNSTNLQTSMSSGNLEEQRRKQYATNAKLLRHQNMGNSLQSQRSQAYSSASSWLALSNNNNNNSTILPGTSSSQARKEVPQFIVPKMNALRLPLVCLIKSINGELMREVFVHRYELGQYLIESLKVSLDINDCKYFGLKLAKSVDEQEDLRNPWLDLNESVCKQIKSNKVFISSSASANNLNHQSNATTTSQSSQVALTNRSIEFYLRIKFYPPNLARVQDTFLREYLWLQLRRDLRLGKLTSSMNSLTFLMACVLQYDLGDYDARKLERVPQLNILPNQDLIEEQAIEWWRSRLTGSLPHQAQMQFLRAAVILETYGFDYYPVRDHQRQRAYLLGYNYAGIKTIRNGRIVHHFRWHDISKVSYERRMIIFHINPYEGSKRKQIIGFKCLTNDDCQNLYMRLLEQKYFFTVDLAYFDKSIRRPTCLYEQGSSTVGGSITLADDGQAQAFTPPMESADCNDLASVAEPRATQWNNCAEPPSSRLNGHTNELSCSSPPNHCNQPQHQHHSHRQHHQSQRRRQGDGSSELTSSMERQWIGECSLCGQAESSRTEGLEDNDLLLNARPTNRPDSHPADYPWDASALGQESREQPPEACPDSGSISLWSKMAACLRGQGPRIRLAQLAESVLVQPTLVVQNPGQVIGDERDTMLGVRALAPALRFCLLIMIMNFLLRMTDTFSSALIELLTISHSHQAASSSVPD